MTALQITIDKAALANLERALSQAPQAAHAMLMRFLTEATAHLQAEVQLATPTAHGTLRASIIGNVTPLADGLGVRAVIGSSLAYAAPVEFGAKPHFIGRRGIDALTDWVMVRMGLRGKEARSVAFAIARKIAKSGTPGAHMFEEAWSANADQVSAQFEAHVAALARQLLGGTT